MRNYCYVVAFEFGPSEIVYAGSRAEAKILGQAERIKKGMDWNSVTSIECAD